MRVYVIDNGGQWTHREWRVLRYLGVETEIVPNTAPVERVADADGLVLSGGAPRIGAETYKLGNTGEYLDRTEIPVLGICVGCQYIAIHFGGEAGPAEVPEYGKTEIEVTEGDTLFRGLPRRLVVWESHNDEIKRLPEDLISLARSKNCRYQAIAHKKRPIFGVQFHPEVEHTEHGYEIFSNFLDECRK